MTKKVRTQEEKDQRGAEAGKGAFRTSLSPDSAQSVEEFIAKYGLTANIATEEDNARDRAEQADIDAATEALGQLES